MQQNKAEFLRTELINRLKQLDPKTPPLFGKMNVWQMVEHMTSAFRIANGKDVHPLITSAERLEPMKNFLMSEKEFRPNTVNVLLPTEPMQVKCKSIDDAFTELQAEIKDFFNYFEKNKDATLTDPNFGDLNFDEWVQLLYKHSLHHLRQFGINF